LPDALIARHAVDEFGLAERRLLLRALGPVHLPAFLEAGRDDVVPAADIGQQILQEVAIARPVPHVMVRVDDRQAGLDEFPRAICRASPNGSAHGGIGWLLPVAFGVGYCAPPGAGRQCHDLMRYMQTILGGERLSRFAG
jgi:hypothetical protein